MAATSAASASKSAATVVQPSTELGTLTVHGTVVLLVILCAIQLHYASIYAMGAFMGCDADVMTGKRASDSPAFERCVAVRAGSGLYFEVTTPELLTPVLKLSFGKEVVLSEVGRSVKHEFIWELVRCFA